MKDWAGAEGGSEVGTTGSDVGAGTGALGVFCIDLCDVGGAKVGLLERPDGVDFWEVATGDGWNTICGEVG